VVTQGWTAIIGGLSYIVYDLVFSSCHLDMHCESLREQQHIAINTLLVVIGIDMVGEGKGGGGGGASLT
jgi:hypothetical protein